MSGFGIFCNAKLVLRCDLGYLWHRKINAINDLQRDARISPKRVAFRVCNEFAGCAGDNGAVGTKSPCWPDHCQKYPASFFARDFSGLGGFLDLGFMGPQHFADLPLGRSLGDPGNQLRELVPGLAPLQQAHRVGNDLAL